MMRMRLLVLSLTCVVAVVCCRPLNTCLKWDSASSSTKVETAEWWMFYKLGESTDWIYFDTDTTAVKKITADNSLNDFMDTHLRWQTPTVDPFNAEAEALREKEFNKRTPKLYEYPTTWGEAKDNQYREREKVQAIVDKIEVVQFFIQDQPAKGGSPKKTTYFNKDKYVSEGFRTAHSKGILSFDVNADGSIGSGYIIQHTMPQSPNRIAKEAKDNFDTYFQRKDSTSNEVHWKSFSQHGFCMTLTTGEETRKILKVLRASRVQIVAATLNIDYTLCKIKNKEDLELIQDLLIPTPNYDCARDWAALATDYLDKNDFYLWDLLAKPIPDSCYGGAEVKSTSIAKTKQEFTFISHASVPVLGGTPLKPAKTGEGEEKDSDGETAAIEENVVVPTVDSEAIVAGPIPWFATAQFISSSLIVSSTRNLDLPPLFSEKICLFNVDEVKFDNKIWSRSRVHEKIGIAPPTSNDQWVCLADSNHRNSEINHAGYTVCFKHSTIWSFLNGIYHVIDIDDSDIPTRVNSDETREKITKECLKLIATKTTVKSGFPRWNYAPKIHKYARMYPARVDQADLAVAKNKVAQAIAAAELKRQKRKKQKNKDITPPVLDIPRYKSENLVCFLDGLPRIEEEEEDSIEDIDHMITEGTTKKVGLKRKRDDDNDPNAEKPKSKIGTAEGLSKFSKFSVWTGFKGLWDRFKKMK